MPARSTRTTPVPNGARLGTRGRRLWRSLAGAVDLTGSRAEVALEACRTADQLEHLHDLLAGDDHAWARVVLPEVTIRGDEAAVEVVHLDVTLQIDNVMSHARMLRATLRALLASLGVVNGETGLAAPPVPVPPRDGGGPDDIDRIAADRAAWVAGGPQGPPDPEAAQPPAEDLERQR